MNFATIPQILGELRAGRMVVIVDDEDRENEGDLIMAAEKVRPEDIISIKADSGASDTVRRATELVSTVPAWLQADHDALTAKVLRYPERSEISAPVQEQLIVELYSK